MGKNKEYKEKGNIKVDTDFDNQRLFNAGSFTDQGSEKDRKEHNSK